MKINVCIKYINYLFSWFFLILLNTQRKSYKHVGTQTDKHYTHLMQQKMR